MLEFEKNNDKMESSDSVNVETTVKSTPKKSFSFKLPTSYTIIAMLTVFIIVLSWIGYMAGMSGQDATGETITVTPLGILDVFPAIWHGFVNASDVILFVLAIGGTLGIMTKLKSIDAGIGAVIKKLQGKEIYMIPVLMFIFGLGGTSYGMWEETIAFFPVLIPVFIKAGFGPVPAVMTILLGAGAGTMASTVNPFLSIIAADSANQVIQSSIEGSKDLTSGNIIGMMMISLVIFEGAAIAFTMWTAKRIKSGKMIVSGLNQKTIDENFSTSGEEIEFTKTRKITLWLFIALFIIMIILILPWADWVKTLGVANDDGRLGWDKGMFWFASTKNWDPIGWWWLVSLSGVFLIMTIIIFLVGMNDPEFKQEGKTSEEVFVSEYINGAKDLLGVALVIGVAAGLKGILDSSNIGPILASSISGLENAGMIGFGIIIFFMSLLIAFFIPSTSGFSKAIIPVFTMVAVNIFGKSGANPEMARAGSAMVIVAFTFAIGVINFVTPTSGALMGYTSYSGLSYGLWIKHTWKYTAAMTAASLLLIVLFGAMLSKGTMF